MTTPRCWSTIGVFGDGSCDELSRHVHCRNCRVFGDAGRDLLDRPPPDGWVDACTQRLATPADAAAPSDRLSTLVFRVGAEWLALSARRVSEITEPRVVHRVPRRTNLVVRGVTSVRGALLLVASLGGLLDIAVDPAPLRPRFVVLDRDGEPWVLPVDEVLGVVATDRSELRALPLTLAKGLATYATALFDVEGRSVGYLDDERVLGGLLGSVQRE